VGSAIERCFANQGAATLARRPRASPRCKRKPCTIWRSSGIAPQELSSEHPSSTATDVAVHSSDTGSAPLSHLSPVPWTEVPTKHGFYTNGRGRKCSDGMRESHSAATGVYRKGITRKSARQFSEPALGSMLQDVISSNPHLHEPIGRRQFKQCKKLLTKCFQSWVGCVVKYHHSPSELSALISTKPSSPFPVQ
jgi:hypothetical protein